MNEDFEKRTREVLEESVTRLDGRTRSRLTQARHAALGQLEASAGARKAGWLRAWAPAAAAASVAVLAVAMWVHQPVAVEVVADTGGDDDMVMLAEAPDFLDETDELDFYEWAAGEVES